MNFNEFSFSISSPTCDYKARATKIRDVQVFYIRSNIYLTREACSTNIFIIHGILKSGE